MATTYKSLSTNDIVTTKTLLHEAIPITGAIVSGTYNDSSSPPVEQNIKNYTHGQFQSVYDYPYLSSSANHIFDITVGAHASSPALSTDAGATPLNRSGLASGSKKNNIYNQMAQVLMGYDENGNIQQFDEDGDLAAGGTKIKEAIFINFSRLVTKDEIKKGSFNIKYGAHETFSSGTATSGEGSGDPFSIKAASGASLGNRIVTIYDKNAQNEYRVNSPAGDYGILYASSSVAANVNGNNTAKVGLIFYQAGVVVLDAGIFHNSSISTSDNTGDNMLSRGFLGATREDLHMNAASNEIGKILVSGSINSIADTIRHRIFSMEFNNTTELNSTVYFCRAHHNEFNYSTNPTYISGSKLVVKNTHTDSPVSYITSVGLYSADNELLAVAKLSEPLKKDPSNELTMRVRLDY